MSNRNFFAPQVLLSIALLSLPIASPAQALYGSVTGNVTDSSSASVASANVEAVNLSTGVSKRALTDERGAYLIQDVQPGMYKLSIDAKGFATTVQSNVQILQNTVRRLDVQLQVAGTGQSVTISADAAVLQTDRADVNAQVSTEELADLPLTGTNGSRSFESVLKVVPGFTPPAPSHSISSNPTMSLSSTSTGRHIPAIA